jgi:hypothetical protein
MKSAVKIFILIPFLSLQHGLNAQSLASLTLDTNNILVGDQVHLKLTFSAPKGSIVQWPILTDTIISKIEILDKTKVDTSLSGDKKRMNYLQVFKITSFDSGFYAIPPVRISYREPGKKDFQTAETPAILLTVSGMKVNMQEDIRDIKKPLSAPFTFREAMPWIIAFLLLAAAGYGVFYYLRKRRRAEPIFRTPVKIRIPAHQIALDALEKLRQKKLWQSGQIKDYHTELTDIIRDYILAKFNIHAPELTSDEIIAALSYTATDEGSKQLLDQTLALADLVKFAKMQPLPADHDTSLANATSFVKATMFFGGGTEPMIDRTETGTAQIAEASASEPLRDINVQKNEKAGKEGKDV